MKNCPYCHAEMDDNAAFCPKCGASSTPGAANPYMNMDPSDHTAEYDPKDISENKVLAMLPYMFGIIGIIAALLAIKESRFVSFHVKQAIKIMVCQTLCVLFSIIPFLGWLATGICVLVLTIVNLICFFNVCSGKAKEAPIVKNLGFLK